MTTGATSLQREHAAQAYHPAQGVINGVGDRLSGNPIAASDVCFHCLQPVPEFCNLSAEIDGRQEPMCCVGCKAASEFIVARGLSKFYQHRSRLEQKAFFAEVATHSMDRLELSDYVTKWQHLDASKDSQPYVSHSADGVRTLSVALEGMYCSSCTWLIEKALAKISPEIQMQADTDAFTVHVTVNQAAVRISHILATLEALGYSPSMIELGDTATTTELAKQHRNSALLRIVVAGFGMMQVMTYATAGYFGGLAEVAPGGTAMNPQMDRFFLLLSMLITTLVVAYSGKPFFLNALSDLRNRHLGMDVPIALAIASAYLPSVYQVLSHSTNYVYFDSAVMFVFFLSLGRYIEMRFRHRVSGVGAELNNALPRTVEVQRRLASQWIKSLIKPIEVQLGDQTHLARGERVPFDGRVLNGAAQVDESLVSGEPSLVSKQPGAKLYAGTLVASGQIELESTGDWRACSMSKIQDSLRAAQSASPREAKYNNLISRYFIAVTLLATLVTGVAWLNYQPARAFEVCLAMLIAACPCAFALAAPMARSAAIHRLRSAGILVTNNKVLQALPSIDEWCLDKTGSLTKGQPNVQKISCLGTLSKERCLELIASIEQHSEHTLASAFAKVQTELVASHVQETIGQGMSAVINDQRYFLGNRNWVLKAINQRPQSLTQAPQQGIEVLLADTQQVLAVVQLDDQLRDSVSPFLNWLRSQQVSLSLLSGDNAAAVQRVAQQLAIADAHAELSPAQKAQIIATKQADRQCVAMLGDGINDAPVLAQADVSVALASGSNLALNNADIVLLNGGLHKIKFLDSVAQRLTIITRQNIAWALAYNLMALSLAATGHLTPWIAALGMSASSLLVTLNALRIQST